MFGFIKKMFIRLLTTIVNSSNHTNYIIKMESNDELKEMCYYFVDIIKIKDSDSHNILIDEKSYENILVYDISYNTMIGTKPLRIRFDKVDVFVRVSNGTRYLVLFRPKKYAIFNRIRYLVSQKSGITSVISHNYARIKVDSYGSLPLEKTLTLHNVIILIQSVFNKNQNHYYDNIFLEKNSYQVPENNCDK